MNEYWKGFAAGWVIAFTSSMIGTQVARADVTASARQTDDPSTVALTVKLDITVKRRLERKVFATAAAEPNGVLALVERPVSKRVRLHKGRNRLTVTLRPQAFRHGFIASPDGLPGNARFFLPVEADTAFFWFGRERAQEVRPAVVAHDTLRDAISTQGEGT